jgi:hypothetical protein
MDSGACPVPGAISLGVKCQEHETDQLPASNTKAKNARFCTSIPVYTLYGIL